MTPCARKVTQIRKWYIKWWQKFSIWKTAGSDISQYGFILSQPWKRLC